MSKIIVVGSGGHAKSCFDVLKTIKKYSFYGYINNTKYKDNIIGTDKDLKNFQRLLNSH